MPQGAWCAATRMAWHGQGSCILDTEGLDSGVECCRFYSQQRRCPIGTVGRNLEPRLSFEEPLIYRPFRHMGRLSKSFHDFHILHVFSGFAIGSVTQL